MYIFARYRTAWATRVRSGAWPRPWRRWRALRRGWPRVDDFRAAGQGYDSQESCGPQPRRAETRYSHSSLREPRRLRPDANPISEHDTTTAYEKHHQNRPSAAGCGSGDNSAVLPARQRKFLDIAHGHLHNRHRRHFRGGMAAGTKPPQQTQGARQPPAAVDPPRKKTKKKTP